MLCGAIGVSSSFAALYADAYFIVRWRSYEVWFDGKDRARAPEDDEP